MFLSFPLEGDLQRKCFALEEFLSPHDFIAVAFSGGMDSAFLAWFVQEALRKKVAAILAVSTLIGRREREGAVDVARSLGLLLEEVELDPLAVPLVRENGKRRCYYCKREIMSRVVERAERLGCTLTADGSHAGDLRHYRPGRQALEELGVAGPLAVARFEKPDIREISRLAGLPTWNKPSQSCLATRIPYGTPLTGEALSAVEEAEDLLNDLGCTGVRVRVHGDLVRIEMNPDGFPLVMEKNAREAILSNLRSRGFHFVSLDLAGYRSGSWDEAD